ncbi:MaoC family dehydratase N-terminal domain-containing protein [Mycobacterium sp. CVI_P3]|uniref:MaoC family dehydratase N-terminal domain-containing protein n=1 Tax=Mycobacterium pinniadriaticum TaxID=2994102 RepID=A0ABT3SF28_9MYCO|nr:MaoC family dehydratase N-terminal domain-containing protein [Mycobacterium pinniadriaticum]MCX2931810.1 MaoC family dehydratase N-terminal domain-containing protein [Mycobacterium pinniadriaticum]MCX2938115.1 MaoC family dehydratase N-terminal domain-containing protein [Mycobacterium pinniadriaticum]
MADQSELPKGTYEDAVAMIGVQQQIQFGEVPVSLALIRVFAATVEDPNPAYWDIAEARRLWGGIGAPPGMLHGWVMPLLWRPDGREERTALSARIPLPGTSLINVSTDVEYFDFARPGDTINVTETMTAVSGEKSTRLGVGHFVTTLAIYRTGTGARIADYRNTLFRYTPHDQDGPR